MLESECNLTMSARYIRTYVRVVVVVVFCGPLVSLFKIGGGPTTNPLQVIKDLPWFLVQYLKGVTVVHDRSSYSLLHRAGQEMYNRFLFSTLYALGMIRSHAFISDETLSG